jgi:ABC-type nitrate/sulfonate/bicarbonate transport system substrate-binding protein
MGFNNLGAAVDYVPDWQFTTYNVNGDWAKANPAKADGFLRAILRATDWIYRNRGPAAEIAAREMNIKPAYAERAWTITRRPALSRATSPSASSACGGCSRRRSRQGCCRRR